jgi:hypothetical protein
MTLARPNIRVNPAARRNRSPEKASPFRSVIKKIIFFDRIKGFTG